MTVVVISRRTAEANSSRPPPLQGFPAGAVALASSSSIIAGLLGGCHRATIGGADRSPRGAATGRSWVADGLGVPNGGDCGPQSPDRSDVECLGPRLGTRQPASQCDEEAAEVLGDTPEGVGRRTGEGGDLAVPGDTRPAGASGSLQLLPPAGDELLGEPRIHSHTNNLCPAIDNFKNIPI